MPVARIHALRPPGLDVPGLLHEISRKVAEAFGCPPEQCWTLFHEIRDGDYLEGGTLRSARSGPHSPIVTLSAYHGRSDEQITAALRGIAHAVTEAFHSDPGDVFVEYHELHPGRVFTGGEVR